MGLSEEKAAPSRRHEGGSGRARTGPPARSDGLCDAGLIGAGQKVEHYEIAAYGPAREMAQQLGLSDAAELLQQTLDEEGETDELLTTIAMRITPAAQEGA